MGKLAMPARQERQPSGDHRMGRRFQPEPTSNHQPQNHSRPCVVGKAFLCRSIDERVNISQPAQTLIRQGPRQSLVRRLAHVAGGRPIGLVERLALSQNSFNQAQSRAASRKSGRHGHMYDPLAGVEMMRQHVHIIVHDTARNETSGRLHQAAALDQ